MAEKTIIVTGASRGIGLAVAKKIIQGGHNVVVLARSTKSLTELEDECPKQVRILPGDISDFSFAQSAVDLALRDFGQLDGLIINHGTMGQINRIEECDLDGWKKVFDVNFFSAVAFAKAALPALRKTSGCILLTSSGASTGAYSAWGAYSSSKAAMNQLAAQLACEEPQITTLSIRPGVVDTDMQKELRDIHYSKMAEKDNQKFQGLHNSGQLLRPEQPGHVMAKIVLDPPKKLSGQYLKQVLCACRPEDYIDREAAGRASSSGRIKTTGAIANHSQIEHACWTSRISSCSAKVSATTGNLRIWHQPKDENTLMLHMTVLMTISFSMKYLESSYAIYSELEDVEAFAQAYLRYSLNDRTEARSGPA